MLVVRLFPGVPFAAANYCAAVSRMGWLAFLLATAHRLDPEHRRVRGRGQPGRLADVPGVPVAGLHRAAGLGAAVVAWRKRHRLRGSGTAEAAATG